jgi:hypothetical protein
VEADTCGDRLDLLIGLEEKPLRRLDAKPGHVSLEVMARLFSEASPTSFFEALKALNDAGVDFGQHFPEGGR